MENFEQTLWGKSGTNSISMEKNNTEIQTLTRKEKVVKYFKKLGWVGFFFFLGKGLLWLIVPYLAAKGLINCNG